MITADLIMFMGQSNMAGRGVTCDIFPQKAPQVTEGAGFEFRAITDPTKLYLIQEPFGEKENTDWGIDDEQRKTGSMVSSFVNAWYETSGVPILAVSASKGGSSILEWQPETPKLTDAIERLHAAKNMPEVIIRHSYMVWCQGETDGDHQETKEAYTANFVTMFSELKKHGIEHCFLVTIGNYNGTENISYREIQSAQEEMPSKVSDVTVVSSKFQTMQKRGLMKDSFHYYQQAYNEVGEEAGTNAAIWAIEHNMA